MTVFSLSLILSLAIASSKVVYDLALAETTGIAEEFSELNQGSGTTGGSPLEGFVEFLMIHLLVVTLAKAYCRNDA